jgi:hypothetical protein
MSDLFNQCDQELSEIKIDIAKKINKYEEFTNYFEKKIITRFKLT